MGRQTLVLQVDKPAPIKAKAGRVKIQTVATDKKGGTITIKEQ